MVGLMRGCGTGQWVEGSIGDDTNAAFPKRDKRPRDY
jgi:hypothetical protein